jgi:hypothetical protein
MELKRDRSHAYGKSKTLSSLGHRKTWMVWILTLSLIPCCRGARDVPTVGVKDGKPVLVLPERMKEFLEDYFEDYRLPGPQDMTGGWASYKNEVPYAAWGDFNGDGRLDLAMILIGKERWRLAELHQTADGLFKEVDIEGSLPGHEDFTRYNKVQNYRVFIVRAGERLVIDGNPVEGSDHKYDSVAFFSIKPSDSGMHCRWNPERGFHSTQRFNNFVD